MRPSKELVNVIVKHFKQLFPVVKDIDFQVYFVPILLNRRKRKLRGIFNTELPDWSPTFKIGIIELSECSNHSVDDYGVTLVHELLHGYLKRVQGLHKTVEELMCGSCDEALWAYIKKKVESRSPLLLVAEALP